MKKYLGLVCLLYAGIIFYVYARGSIGNFLAPNMQVYLKLSFLPLLLMGIIFCFIKDIHYHFKASDFLLLVPIIFLVLADDGLLSTNFAKNRMTNFKMDNADISSNLDEEKEGSQIGEIDFTNVDIEVIDENYNVLADYLTFVKKAEMFEGKKIRLRGFTLLDSYVPSGYFAIGKYVISCCAADAEFTGFIAKTSQPISSNTWYEVEGILEKYYGSEDDISMVIKVINLKSIDIHKEEQYVYPCFNYGDGKCSAVGKYSLDY